MTTQLPPNDADEDVTARAALNQIAEHWSPTDGLPEEIPIESIADYYHPIEQEIGDLIIEFESETPFSKKEAQVWILNKYHDDKGHFLTNEAIALWLSIHNFVESEDSTTSEEATRRWIQVETVEDRIEQANATYEQARELIGKVTFANRDEVLDIPEVHWLDQQTISRLSEQKRADEDTLDETLNRLLDTAERRQTLGEFVREYLTARGPENVAQVAVSEDSFKTNTLMITAHTALTDEPPELVEKTNALSINGQRYEFKFVESEFGPQSEFRVTMYASDDIRGMEEVTLSEGIANARQYLQELPDEELPR